MHFLQTEDVSIPDIDKWMVEPNVQFYLKNQIYYYLNLIQSDSNF